MLQWLKFYLPEKHRESLYSVLEDKSNGRIRVYDRVFRAELIENSEEGNRKIVDGVIKVGSVVFRRLSLMSPRVSQATKKNLDAGSPAPKHEQQCIIYISFG